MDDIKKTVSETIAQLNKLQNQLAGMTSESPLPGLLHSTAPWMKVAESYLGVKEVKGEDKHHPDILRFLKSTDLGAWGANRDETPWCSAFVNYCFESPTGTFSVQGTRSARARSWLGWGVELEKPRYGCVVVLKRGKAPKGHVGFYMNPHKYIGHFEMLGGNQNDSVCIGKYRDTDVLGYRWPE